MNKKKIGVNAGIIWNLLNDHCKWNINEIKDSSGLSEFEILTAIGWLARENKIEIEYCPDGLVCFYLVIEYYF